MIRLIILCVQNSDGYGRTLAIDTVGIAVDSRLLGDYIKLTQIPLFWSTPTGISKRRRCACVPFSTSLEQFAVLRWWGSGYVVLGNEDEVPSSLQGDRHQQVRHLNVLCWTGFELAKGLPKAIDQEWWRDTAIISMICACFALFCEVSSNATNWRRCWRRWVWLWAKSRWGASSKLQTWMVPEPHREMKYCRHLQNTTAGSLPGTLAVWCHFLICNRFVWWFCVFHWFCIFPFPWLISSYFVLHFAAWPSARAATFRRWQAVHRGVREVGAENHAWHREVMASGDGGPSELL